MSERTIRFATGALALAGATIAGYLLYVRAMGDTLVCASSGCETVQASRYSEVLGVPVAGIGLAGYLALLGLAVARGETARLAGASIALAAFAFSAYLLALQLLVIDAVCAWCVASDAITTAIAALALLRLHRPVLIAPAAG